ncbi:MAG: helicase-related protein [Sulfuricella sp.]
MPELRNVPYANFLIHDYFFAKAMEVVRPGGLVVFITSSGTMDKYDDKVRQYLGSKANLVAAVRLPNTAFKRIANTEVTTDILVLQKPLEGRSSKKGWMETIVLPETSQIYGESREYWRHQQISCNQYFADNPQWVIGKLALTENGYQKSTGCIFEGDLESALAEKVSMLPESIYAAIQEVEETKVVLRLEYNDQGRPGFRVINGKVYETDGLVASQFIAPQKTLERIAGMCGIRDAARKIVRSQVETGDEAILAAYRLMLNIEYDNFVAKCGSIHTRANRAAFKGEPDLPLLMSLERWDEETQTAEKADIFFQRTVGMFKKVDHCETSEEALLVSLTECGHVVENRIGQLLGKPGSEAMNELEELGAVFLDPQTGNWETKDSYLAGNVRNKLSAARVSGERYSRNAQALEAVIPDDLTPGEIGARIGSTWIPTSDYEAFLDETLECNGNTVTFNQAAGAWNVDLHHSTRSSIAATQTFGTERVNAATLFDQALNQTVPTVHDPDPEDRDKRVVNQKETIAAREKQQSLKEKFQEWLWSEQGRALRLARLYNDTFNSVVPRRFDGRHLVLPGYSRIVSLHEHQRDAIWRIVASQLNTLLAHVVGAGKTLTCICAGMELRRLGKASKPMYVVPNHMLHQFAAEFLRAYPGANILIASKDDLQGDKRRQLLSRIATGDWDGVLITHASFERIKMSDGFMEEYIQNEIDLIEDAIRAEKQERGNRIVKELARAKKAWEAKLAKMSGKNKKDEILSFEQLGIDWMFVDEAHLFKNLWRFSKMTRVAGLPNSNSERAFDMFVKTRSVMAKHKGRAGVVFATGTPVSNSMAEMWVMQRYLQPKTMEAFQVGMFDTWAGNFGESVTALELAPDGRGYRMHTRFAKFVNLPELMSMFGEVADIRTAEMLKLPVPAAHKETVTIKPTADLKALVQTLVERAEAIRNGNVSPSVDNMLAVTNDGRKAALDMRLIDSFAEVENGKVNHCAEKVFGIWGETRLFRGTQIVFCDLSTPVENGRFSVYQALRQNLLERGVPIEDIAFIHDYESDSAKEELFKAARDGRIRILLGSTQKMGVGTNIQTRLAALHHLDAPWRPSDVEQREGRIIRQGNLNERVRIYRYVTEGSFDAYIWQTLETKARFIAQVMQGDTGMRSAEDVELAALSYAEVKALASGNPLVLEKAGVDTELAKLSLLRSQWDQQQWRNKQELATLPGRIERVQARITGIESDMASRQDVSGSKFLMEVEGSRYTDRAEAGKALLHAVYGVRSGGDRIVGQIAGFRVAVQLSALQEMGRQLVVLGGVEYRCGQAESAQGFVRVLENALNRMEQWLLEEQEYLARTEKRMADIHAEAAKPFDKAARLEWLKQRQREIEAELDLSKGENTAVDETEESLKKIQAAA